MKTLDVQEKLARIESLAREATAELAEDVRTQVIIPLCRRHKLTFTSGNGSYCFHRANGEPIGSYSPQGIPGYLARVYEMLDADTYDRFTLGHHIGSVNESEASEA